MLVTGDENDVNASLKYSGAYKAAVTGDPVNIQGKYKDGISYAFHGLIIECLNSVLIMADKTDSSERRKLVIPFKHNFQGSQTGEIKEIKGDYLHREDVLQYIAYHVLVEIPEYYELSIPRACIDLQKSMEIDNNPVLDYALDRLDVFAWDFIPFKLLFQDFRCWMSEHRPNSREWNEPKFTRALRELLLANKIPGYTTSAKHDNGKQRLNKSLGPEPLLAKYNLQLDYTRPYAGVIRTIKFIPASQTEVSPCLDLSKEDRKALNDTALLMYNDAQHNNNNLTSGMAVKYQDIYNNPGNMERYLDKTTIEEIIAYLTHVDNGTNIMTRGRLAAALTELEKKKYQA